MQEIDFSETFEDNDGIYDEISINITEVQSALNPERIQCLKDRRFYSIAGAQWEGRWGLQYENRPRLEINKIHRSVIDIIQNYRQNRVTVEFVSKSGKKRDTLADICRGAYRADEQRSNAFEAYDNGFEEAVGGGFGAWRLSTEYEDEEDPENENQKICIEPIYDADNCVFFDLSAKRQDKRDATFAFILSSFSPESATKTFGFLPSTIQRIVTQSYFDFTPTDLIYVAEYFKVEHKKEKILYFKNGAGEEEKIFASDFKDGKKDLDDYIARGYIKVRERTISRRRVRKYIVDGARVLKDCGYIHGPNIPIVPVYGKRWFIDGIERCMGHVRLASDPQRLFNMEMVQLAEQSSLSSVERPIFFPQQMVGHEALWAMDNINNYNYMIINPTYDKEGNIIQAGPVGFTKPPQISPATAALIQVTDSSLKEMLGNNSSLDNVVGNVSGEALRIIEKNVDSQANIYMSNFVKSMQRCGEIWLGMAREIYIEASRILKTIGNDGDVSFIEVNSQVLDIKTGAIVYDNDIESADFEVYASVGPTSDSEKESALRAITALMQVSGQNQQTLDILAASAALNLKGENLGPLKKFFRKKLILAGVETPTDSEREELAAELQSQGPDAQSEYLKAASEEAVARAAALRADTIKTISDSELNKAKTVETMSKAALNRQEIIGNTLNA